MSTAPVRRDRRREGLPPSQKARDDAHAPVGAASTRRSRGRVFGFGAVVVTVLLVGGYLAFGDFLGQRGATTAANAIPVRLSMAGFTPSEIRVKAGETARLELWTTDAAPHLEGGVHTMISHELGLYEELPAAGLSGESRRTITVTAPMTPGTYDFWCDTCCGGEASPTMHGRLVVEG